jgi:hypothetical protein
MDIDVGNRDRTDVAFVSQEDWGSANNTAIALADVVLHEAGHTFGLAHVNSGTALESMGLRYSISDQSRWVQDTTFLNQTFPSLYAGSPSQNSYQVMAATFGTTSNPLAAPAVTYAWEGTSNRPVVDCGVDHLRTPTGELFHYEVDDEDFDFAHEDHVASEAPAGNSMAGLLSGLAASRGASNIPQRAAATVPQLGSANVSTSLLDLVHELRLEENELHRSTTGTPATVLELDDALAAWEENLVAWN